MNAYTDYLFGAKTLDIIDHALTLLRQYGIIEPEGVPINMLGNEVVLPSGTVIRGAQDADGMWHVAIRTRVPPSELPFDPTALGLVADDPTTSAAVLGIWY